MIPHADMILTNGPVFIGAAEGVAEAAALTRVMALSDVLERAVQVIEAALRPLSMEDVFVQRITALEAADRKTP